MLPTKEFIIKTSLRLFLQKSYKDVTMREILNKTGLSKGGFYHHFASKEELFREIANYFYSMGKRDYSTFSNESFNKFYHQYAALIVQTIQELIEMVDFNSNDRTPFNFFFIMFEAANRFPELLEIELNLHEKELAAWKKIIKIARKMGEIKSNAADKEIAEMFLYCNDGLLMRIVYNNQMNISQKDIIKIFDCIYDGLKV